LLALSPSKIDGITLPAVISVTSRRLIAIPGFCPPFRDVVQHSGITEKVDTFRTESLDNFDRNRWTTSNGEGGQLQTEWPDNIERNTHTDKATNNGRQ
jgi:hypothetical protein